METITKNNFHLATKTYFKELAYGNKASEMFKALAEDNGVFFKSKSMSQYIVMSDLVYRYSDHWGRVASCDWELPRKNYLQKNNLTFTLAVSPLSDFISKSVSKEEMIAYNKRMFNKI